MVTDIEDMEGMEDEEVLFGAVQSGSEVWVRGIGMDLDTDLKYEGEVDNLTVRCECGARDDDGNRPSSPTSMKASSDFLSKAHPSLGMEVAFS